MLYIKGLVCTFQIHKTLKSYSLCPQTRKSESKKEHEKKIINVKICGTRRPGSLGSNMIHVRAYIQTHLFLYD